MLTLGFMVELWGYGKDGRICIRIPYKSMKKSTKPSSREWQDLKIRRIKYFKRLLNSTAAKSQIPQPPQRHLKRTHGKAPKTNVRDL